METTNKEFNAHIMNFYYVEKL